MQIIVSSNWRDGVQGRRQTDKAHGSNLINLPIGLEEVRAQVDVEQIRIGGESLQILCKRKDMDPLSIQDGRACRNRDNITKTNAEVVPDDAVATDLNVLTIVISKDDADSVLALLPLEQDGVTSEEVKLLHLRGRECYDTVIIVGSVVDKQTIRGLLLVQNGCGEVLRLLVLCLRRWVRRACAVVRHGAS